MTTDSQPNRLSPRATLEQQALTFYDDDVYGNWMCPPSVKDLDSGVYPRGIGRTTARMLQAIADALLQPDHWIAVVDHDGLRSPLCTLKSLQDKIDQLHLRIETRFENGLVWLRSPMARIRQNVWPVFGPRPLTAEQREISANVLDAISRAMRTPGEWIDVPENPADPFECGKQLERARLELKLFNELQFRVIGHAYSVRSVPLPGDEAFPE